MENRSHLSIIEPSKCKLNQSKKSLFALLVGAVIFLSSYHQLHAQKISNFQNYSSKNGFPSNEVYDMYQDKNGLLWFATNRGLCTYNGYKFESLGLRDGLTSTTILKFYPQVNGDIWCSTINNRLFYFNPRDYIIQEYKYNDLLEEKALSGASSDLFIEQNGSIHLSFTNLKGIFSIDSKGTVFNSADGYEFKRPCTYIEQTDNGIFYYLADKKETSELSSKTIQIEIANFNVRFHKVAKQDSILLISDFTATYYLVKNQLIRSIKCDKRPIGVGFWDKNHFWIGYELGGIVIYDLNGNSVATFLDGKSVSSALIDHESGVWISTISDGLFYNKDISVSHYKFDTYANQLSLDEDGELLANLYNGDFYTEKDGYFELSRKSETNRVLYSQFYKSIQGSVFTTHGAVSHINIIANGKFHQPFETSYINKLSDNPEQLPMIACRNFFYIVSPSLEISKYAVKGSLNDVCQANNGAYLAKHNGLFYYNFTTKKERKLTSKHLNFRINDVDCLNDDRVFVATIGNGLVIIEKDKTWAITEEDGLTSDLTSEVFIQNDSIIWVCTNKGLNRVTLKRNGSYSITTFTVQNGLYDNFTTDVEVIDEIVWVSTLSGISSFHLKNQTKKIRKRTFFLRLADVKVNDKREKELTNLSYSQNNVEINFQAISFRTSLIYRYKLSGLDDTWYETSNTKVIYEALQPGEYIFYLQVGTEGNWSGEQISVPITIYPPYYKTFWFAIICIISIAFLIYLFFRYRILSYNRDITREILRQLLRRLKTKSMSFIVEVDGKSIKINSDDILYVQSSRNYIEMFYANNRILVRDKISNFLNIVPDPIEYIRVSRSYIVRIDKITSKSKKSVWIGEKEIKVGNTYQDTLSKIHL